MSCWVIIPAKAPGSAKGRLASALDPAARARLAAAMLDKAVAAVARAQGVTGFALVGEDRLGQDSDITLLPEPSGGLNAAVTSARGWVFDQGATRIITLAADLPQICPADVEALCAMPAGVIGLAPDRHGTGTNALSLPLPQALDFAYAYGLGSRARHEDEAARLGLTLVMVNRSGLARDVDEPADLTDAEGLHP